MAFSYQTFDKLQDEDLVSALARRQADEEGRLRIHTAMQQAQAAQANESIRRDNAETNRMYRQGIVDQREFENESEAEKRRIEGEKITAETADKKERKEALIKLANDPNAPVPMRQQAMAQLAGMEVKPFDASGGESEMVPTAVRMRNGTLQFGPNVPKNLKILPETTPSPSFTLINTPEGQFNFDRRTGRMGDRVADLAPLANERERAAANASIDPFLNEVDQLSQRINTHEGLMATAVGATERQAAKVNLAKDVALYVALVQSMTPLAARAFGHTGVLTQMDVDSARAILPDVEDSKDLRDAKMSMLLSLVRKIREARRLGGTAQSPGQSTAQTPPAATAPPAAVPTPTRKKFELLP